MNIILVRHGEVIKSHIGKYNGHIDISLSQNGKNQVKRLSQELHTIKFDKVYCSDLLRTRETLEIFELNQEIIYSDQLREKSWGKHEGMSFEQIQESGIEYKNFEQWISALDGESIDSYTKKIKNYFETTIFTQNAHNILVVTHSGVIKTFLSIVNDYSLEEAFAINLPYASYITYNMTFKGHCLDIISQ